MVIHKNNGVVNEVIEKLNAAFDGFGVDDVLDVYEDAIIRAILRFPNKKATFKRFAINLEERFKFELSKHMEDLKK